MQDSTGRKIWVRAAALVIGLSLLAILWLFARVFAMLILGVAIAAALAPLVGWLARFIPRGLAVVLIYLVLILILVGLGWVIFPPLFNQASALVQNIPDQLIQLEETLSKAGIDVNQLSLTDMLSSQVSQLGSIILSLPFNILSYILDIVLVIFISLYSLIEAPGLNRFLRSLFQEEQGSRVVTVLEDMSEAMGGYIRGTVINSVIVGVLTFVGLLIIGVEYPVVLGLLAGLMEIIPILGPIIAGGITVAITLLQSPGQALIVLIFFIVLQQLENHILAPNIMRSQTNVSPLLVILALFAGSLVGGLLGALVAIPLAAALNVLVLEVVAPALRERNGVKHDQA